MSVLGVIEISGDFGPSRRAALAAALAGAQGAVLLRIASTGVPEAELGDGAVMAEVAELCRAVETRAAPVVAILSGAVRGAALELALAAAARVAVPDAVFGFEEVALGLVPAGGATQRLPRLVGGAEALRLLQGAQVDAVTALAVGMVDAVTEGDGVAEAVELVTLPPKRQGLRDGRGFLAAVAAARGAATLPAVARLVDCVEAALMLPFEQGLTFERVCFDDLRASDEAEGLLQARRSLAVAAGGRVHPVARLGVWGAGPAAVRLVLQALRAGLEVQLAAEGREAVVRALADVAEAQEAEVQSAQLSPEARDAEWARLFPQVGADGLAGVDLTVMTEAGAVAGPRIAYGVALPDVPLLTRFEGLAEVAAAGAAPDTVARALGLAQAMGWVPVVTGAGGPVVLRLATALAEAVSWVEAQGIPRGAVAQSLATAGIAGEGAGQAGPEDETARRCMAALANEGARLIAEGVVGSAAHVDAVAMAAGLVARWTGGPMHRANRRGLMVLRRDLRAWAGDDAALWSPSPSIDAMIAEGRGFI